jgi:hypothetical protein
VEAYRQYRRGHIAVRQMVLALSRLAPGADQTLAFRGAAVLICAEFEAYLRELVQERLDAIAAGWDAMVVGEQRVVAAQLMDEMSRLTAQLDADSIREGKDAAKVAATVRRLASWIEIPGQFARDVPAPRLDLLGDSSNVARAVARILIQLRDDHMQFWDWLGSKGVDRDAHKLSLESLVDLRNDVAHQNRRDLKPTAEDLRTHQRRLARLVRCTAAYVANAPSGVAVVEDEDGIIAAEPA